MKYAIRTDGKPAVTHYTVREPLGARKELTFTLETGRTHQIRVQWPPSATRSSTIRFTAAKTHASLWPVRRSTHGGFRSGIRWRARISSSKTGTSRRLHRRQGGTAPAVIAQAAPFTLHAVCGSARRGTLALAHGAVETPAFMPVGTAATVKAPRTRQSACTRRADHFVQHLSPLAAARLGNDRCGRRASPLHGFGMADPHRQRRLPSTVGIAPLAFGRRRDVCVPSRRKPQRFTPENVVAFQEAIGVDVAMALDVCVKLPASSDAIAESVRLTTRWAQRSAAARSSATTLLFGIVQGGLDERMRERSARNSTALDLPGYAIGGLSVGERAAISMSPPVSRRVCCPRKNRATSWASEPSAI